MRGIHQFCTFLLFYGILLKGLQSSEEEKRLLSKLFHEDNHDVAVRPVNNSKEAIRVNITLSLYQLIDIDEKHQTIELSAWLTTKWADYQMRWNPDEYNGIEKFNVRPNDIWLPDIVLYNNVNEDNAEFGGNMDTLKTRVMVYHTGEMFWIAPLIIKGHCEITVREFPFDTQDCTLRFGSWTYTMKALDLHTDGIDVSEYSQNNEWNLKNKTAVRHEVKYECCPGLYPDVRFHLYFERRSLFYVLNLIFPIAMITALTIIAFLLPQESGERIGLSVTLMLAVTVFMLLVAEITPESSEGLPIVSRYFIFCVVLIFVIIVVLCYMSRLYTRGRTDRQMGRWTRNWILDYLSYIFLIRHHNAKKCIVHCASVKKEEGILQEEIPYPKTSPTAFVNGYICTEREKNLNQNRPATYNDPGSILRRISRSSSMTSAEAMQLEEAIRRLDEMDHQNNGDNRNDGDYNGDLSFEEEWRVVAMTIDRILLILSIIVFIIGTVVSFVDSKYVY